LPETLPDTRPPGLSPLPLLTRGKVAGLPSALDARRVGVPATLRPSFWEQKHVLAEGGQASAAQGAAVGGRFEVLCSPG
jgi:hypothetical protein